MTEEESEKIDKFLTGELSPQERKLFNDQLDGDEVLRQRVKLRQSIGDYLKSDEGQFVELLVKADKQHYDQPQSISSSIAKWWWLILPLVLGVILLWVQSYSIMSPGVSPNDKEDQKRGPVIETKDSLKEVSPARDTVPDNIAPPSAPVPAVAPQNTPRDAPLEPTASEPPIFAQLDPVDYVANPLLEGLINEQVRSGIDSTTITFSVDVDTLRLSNISTITLNGYSTVSPPYEVLVFDNKESSFIEDKPLIRRIFQEEALENGHRFQLGLEEVTSAGRYYILMIDQEGEILDAASFLVR